MFLWHKITKQHTLYLNIKAQLLNTTLLEFSTSEQTYSKTGWHFCECVTVGNPVYQHDCLVMGNPLKPQGLKLKHKHHNNWFLQAVECKLFFPPKSPLMLIIHNTHKYNHFNLAGSKLLPLHIFFIFCALISRLGGVRVKTNENIWSIVPGSLLLYFLAWPVSARMHTQSGKSWCVLSERVCIEW